MKNIFNVHELPRQEMESLGLIDAQGNHCIDPEDLDALLAGRRTALLSLNDLDAGSFRIERLDAKLSLHRNADGSATFKLHPIYKEPAIPSLLDEDEALSLINGERLTVEKVKPGSARQEVVFEFDPETREFVSYDPDQVLVPDKINGHDLTEAQKDDFKKGLPVELRDGTTVQHRATDPKGIRADRAALIFSVLVDGGLSYLLIRGISHLMNSRQPQADGQTPAFREAYTEMKQQQGRHQMTADRHQEESRGYTRTHSR